MVHVQEPRNGPAHQELHPETPVAFGGISSTYYADQLIQCPFIDMVMKGYDTHEPMAHLLTEIQGARRFDGIVITWKRGGVW
jgi:clorobiocin biosynthesis protein CloN6